MPCSKCPRPAVFRSVLLIRWPEQDEPVLYEPTYFCEIHRTPYEAVAEAAPQALRGRIEADLRKAKLPLPDWSRTQVVFEPVEP